MKRILFVDDDQPVLNALQNLGWDRQYQVLTAGSGLQALEIMDRLPVDLVVSDMRMPGMDGSQLLQIMKARHPATIRVVLSAYVDEKLVIRTLLDNLAKIYLYKPVDHKMLQAMIDHLFETEALLQDNELLAVIKSTGELPTIRLSFRHILHLMDGDPSVEEVAREIEKDQAIAGKLLHIANSAFYGLKTGSVNQAVKYLGFNTIRNLVLSTPIMDSLSISGPDGESVEKQWKHAFLTNSILTHLYERHLRRRLDEVEGTAGLLHNIGVAFLIKQYRLPYLHILQPKDNQAFDLCALERELFKATHAEIGGYLMRWWDLPYPIVESAIFHHAPLDGRVINRTLVQAVHVAQHYAFYLMNEPGHGILQPEVFTALGIDREQFEGEMRSQRILF